MVHQKWLKTFKVLVETQHFTKTAEKLFMTQPGVSQHILKLEEQLSSSLIVRVGKKFEITDQGLKVYQYAKELEANEQALIDDLQVDSPFKGECAVSMSGSLCQLIYPKLVALQVKYPELNISVESAPESKIYQQIKDNKIGFGLVTGKQLESAYEFIEIGNEQICLLGSLERLDKENENVLANIPVVQHPDVWHYLRLIFSKNKFLIEVDQLIKGPYINQIDQILLPVSEAIGFTALPIHAIASSKYGDSVKVINQDYVVTQSIYLIKKKNFELPTRYQQLITAIKECIN
ncbi:LysR family transcriptional regulator [Shewanella sp. OPT22]|nr:LysR family transcriptional regulator [Shewanella sp. OPT22]